MKFIGIRDFRNKSASVWRELRRENELIITSNGKPVAILSAVTEDNLEENLKAFREARALSAVTALQRESFQRGADRISLDQINEEIRAERKKYADESRP
jgi:prevent-host-death family protein